MEKLTKLTNFKVFWVKKERKRCVDEDPSLFKPEWILTLYNFFYLWTHCILRSATYSIIYRLMMHPYSWRLQGKKKLTSFRSSHSHYVQARYSIHPKNKWKLAPGPTTKVHHCSGKVLQSYKVSVISINFHELLFQQTTPHIILLAKTPASFSNF